MLTNQVHIISSNQWSKRLTRILNLNLIHGIYKYSIPRVQYKKDTVKQFNMSEENNTSDIVGTPSTSASSNWDCNCGNVETSGYSNLNSVNNNSHMVMINPVIAVQGITSISYGVNYCPANLPFLNEIFVDESMSRRYYHRYQTDGRMSPLRSRSMERYRNKNKEVLSVRVWENTWDKKSATKPGFIFTLMSYNVLAQDLLENHSYLYRHHNQDSLDWKKKRWSNLFKEIRKFNPDILCLQEVQESHIKNYFSLLETLGYKSLYKKRTGVRTEGCALYYKTDVINLVEYTTVEYRQPGILILNRDNVAIVAKFTPKLHPTREFVIATTHLLYNPRRQDVRLAQMQILLTEVERISYKKKDSQNGDSYLPVIITGDLNSTPNSAVYELITKGKLHYDKLSSRRLIKGTDECVGKVLVPPQLRITDNCQHADLVKKRLNNEKTTRTEEMALIKLENSDKRLAKISEKTEYEPELFSTGTLSHNFAFKSVYGHGKPDNNEGTTYQDEWLTVDYIFYSANKDEIYSEDKLKLLARYRLPIKSELRDVRIPNSTLGSDHLSLLAKFKLEY